MSKRLAAASKERAKAAESNAHEIFEDKQYI